MTILSIIEVVVDQFSNCLERQLLFFCILMCSLILVDDLVPSFFGILVRLFLVRVKHLFPCTILVIFWKFNIKSSKVFVDILFHPPLNIFFSLLLNMTNRSYCGMCLMLFKIKLVVQIMHLFHDDNWFSINIILFLLWGHIDIKVLAI